MKKTDVPMSENQRKYHANWTAEDCCDELRRIAKMDETRVVSRNFFRNHSKISEATWNRYFGTFLEFKRQAGVVLSRQQHGLERGIAKHASVDHYREYNIKRGSWGANYIRENQNRFKTIITCSDLHDIEVDRFYLRVLIDTIRRVQPDVICFVGDVFDLPEFGRYTVDPREWDVVNRIKFVHEEIFKPIREASPNSQLDLIEGNHEARLLRHVADASPALRTILGDLHGLSVRDLLGLTEFEVNYIAKLDLAAFTKADLTKELSKNYQIYWDSFLAHHYPHGKNQGLPGVNGHHHRHMSWGLYNHTYGSYEWHQLGSGHHRDASFAEGEQWNNGFAICNVDTKTKSTAFDYVFVGSGHTVVGGQWYYRDKKEIIRR